MKIVINSSYGGFGLSNAAIEEYAKKSGIVLYKYVFTNHTHWPSSCRRYDKDVDEFRGKVLVDEDDIIYSTTDAGSHCILDNEEDRRGFTYFNLNEISRIDKNLIDVVEEMGYNANGSYAELKVVEIPDGCCYKIVEQDGRETLYYSNTPINVAR